MNGKIYSLLFLFSMFLCGRVPTKSIKQATGKVGQAQQKIESAKKREQKIPQDYIKLDEIKVIVHGPIKSEILCASDDGMPGLDGRPMNIGKKINYKLAYQDALNLKMPLEDDVVKAQLERTIRGFGLKPGQEHKIFSEVGYTYEEGFAHFKEMYAVNSVTDFKVRSDLVITEDQVIKYWQENPIAIEEKFCFKTVFIESVQKGSEGTIETSKEVEKRIDYHLKNNATAIAWSEPFWMKKSEIAQELESIAHLKVNEVKKIPQRNGFQLYQLVEHEPEKLVSLQERYRDIVNTLQKPMYQKKLDNYHQELLKGATIIYL